MTLPNTNNSSNALFQADSLKSEGNDAFRRGDVSDAIKSYTLGLECIPIKFIEDAVSKNEIYTMSATLLSNRAMCRLKQFDDLTNNRSDESSNSAARTKKNGSFSAETDLLLTTCIEDCTLALQHLDGLSHSNDANQRTRSKLLYRRAKAVMYTALNQGLNGHARDQKYNLAAKDLLQLLSFDAHNNEAVSLLTDIRSKHASLGEEMGRSRIAKILDELRSAAEEATKRTSDATMNLESTASIGKDNSEKEEKRDTLQFLRFLQGSLVDDSVSSSEEIGRRGGVPLLLHIAMVKMQPNQFNLTHLDSQDQEQCRIASLHILSSCCSHDSFILKYALRDRLPPQILAQIVEEESALSNSYFKNATVVGSADVAVAAMALLVRLIVHWHHREIIRFFAPAIKEDGTVDEMTCTGQNIPEVEGSSICRVAIAAFSWECNRRHENSIITDEIDARAPRAALDLLSAWTASDLDALDSASESCFDSSPSISSASKISYRKVAHHKLTNEDMRRMKPRQVAAHRKRQAEYQRRNVQRALQHISMFCSHETGGLDAMLECTARAKDHRLRREVGLQIGRMISIFEEEDDVKKNLSKALGCYDWTVGKEKKGAAEESDLEKLTIEEVNEEKEDSEVTVSNSAQDLFSMMKRGQLAASLLVGKPDVGTWALKYGWSNGNGIKELKQLISSNDPCAMSIASELVSSAASVESARPILSNLFEEGTLDDLLVHPDADVRSGAASCAAKIGLASKALSEDEGEVIGLLDIAIELLYEDDELDGSDSIKRSLKTDKLSKLIKINHSTESTSMERGVEVISYLVSKTFVKDKLAHGYKPELSPSHRKTAIQRLVEIASAKSGDPHMAYGIANIFNLLSVTSETLQNEAFIGTEITKEQYDQLQELGKTEEEKELAAKRNEIDGDNCEAVSQRIQKMAATNVPQALVKLLEESNSNATQEKLLEAMGRMASEQSVRGVMIQQGCLSACLQLDKGEKPNETEKKIIRSARSCVAKLLVTTNPNILTVSQRSGSVGPLIQLVKDHDALDLMHFEALLSLTNLAAFGDETKNRIVAQKGIPALSYAMFSDHEMVRQAATEALCNMVPHPDMIDYLRKEENLKVWVAFACDFEENLSCASAAVGGLAMAVSDPDLAKALVRSKNFGSMVRSLLECGHLNLMHRVLALITGLIEQGGACRKAVVATGAGAFCDAYVLSYHDGQKLKGLKFSSAERGTFVATLNLAKEVATLLR